MIHLLSMPPKAKKKVGGKVKPKAKSASKSASKPAAKREMPLAERAEDAKEVREIKERRDKIIAKKPNDPKWVESAHLACAGLYKCYKHGERSKCLKDIHDKLDKLEK